MLNFIALPAGAMQNRPGTKQVSKIKDSTAKPRLVPFVYSTTQTYVLEIGFTGGAGYIRFYQNGGQVISGGVPYEVAAAPWLQAALPYLRWAQSGDTLMVCYGGQDAAAAALAPQDIRRLGHTNWTVGSASFSAMAYGSFAGTQIENPGNQPDATHPAKPWWWQATQFWKENATGNLFETTPAVILPKLGIWSSITTYAQGEMVVESLGTLDVIWTSLQNANTNHAPSTSPTWWVRGIVLSSSLTPFKLTLTFGAIAGFTFQGFGIYRGKNTNVAGGARTGLVGLADANATQFIDDGSTEPDYTQQPQQSTNPFDIPAGGHDYPSSVGYFEQRRVFARQGQHPTRIQGSKIGQIGNFDTTLISQDDDAVSFDLASATLDEIRAIVPTTSIFVLTQSGVWTVRGFQGSALTPTSVNARKQHDGAGASWVTPARLFDSIVYEQDGGGAIWDFTYNFLYDIGHGRDISLVAQHFFEGHTIVSMAYAARPRKTLWVVRDDGLLLGCTYVPDPQAPLTAWHQHTTDGTVEDVCVVPEGTEEAVYLLVNRTINGQTQRSVERMQTRLVTDVRLGVFLDAALSFDGRNTLATTMKATGATYNGGDEVTVLASVASFVPEDVGNAIVFDPDAKAGGPFRLTVKAYTDTTHVTAQIDAAALPIAFQNVASTSWGFARRAFKGLDHLEGKTVSALADGAVATAAAQGSSLVVAAGQIAIDVPAVIVHAGLPYVSDLELLDLSAGKLNVKSITKVALEVVSSRAMWAGETFDKLKEARPQMTGDAWGNPALKTGLVPVVPNSTWNTGGRACFRQVDPLPLTVLAAIREVVTGGT